jgi:hypothetical protein
MNDFFEETRSMGLRRLKRQFDKIWLKCFTDTVPSLPYYVNQNTKETQWTPPYQLQTFLCMEIEDVDFLEVMFRYQVLAMR